MGIFIGGPLDGQSCEYYSVRGDEVVYTRAERRPRVCLPTDTVKLLEYRRKDMAYEFPLYDTRSGGRVTFYVLSTFTEDEALSRCHEWTKAYVSKYL